MRPTTLPLILWLRCNSTPIRLRYDYDPTTTRLLPIRRKQKMNMSIFRRSRIVVVSLSNRNCDIGLSQIATDEILLRVYHNCDSTTIGLRYNDTMTHSTTTEVIEITICVRFDCDTTTIRLRQKIDIFVFLHASNRVSRRMEAGARDTS